MKQHKSRKAETVQIPPLKVTGLSQEVVTAILEDRRVPCFRCGRPAVGVTTFLTAKKDGTPSEERDVAVCEDCYAVLKEKVRNKSRLSD